eukprot:8680208-Pyramimonas_sp.AAC.1
MPDIILQVRRSDQSCFRSRCPRLSRYLSAHFSWEFPSIFATRRQLFQVVATRLSPSESGLLSGGVKTDAEIAPI